MRHPPLASTLPTRETPASVAAHWRRAFGWATAAIACLIFGKFALDAAPLGPLARHMAEHLLLMNAVAPLLAVAIISGGLGRAAASGRSVLAATLVQLGLLWAWHAPTALDAALRMPEVHLLMQASLAAAAVWFWLAVASGRDAFRWRALFALLVTGKLFCLLGILLVFAPRLLYGEAAPAHGRHLAVAAGGLSDQHLAGLLMVVVCPLTYVLAGVVIAAQWLRDLARASAKPARAS